MPQLRPRLRPLRRPEPPGRGLSTLPRLAGATLCPPPRAAFFAIAPCLIDILRNLRTLRRFLTTDYTFYCNRFYPDSARGRGAG